MTSEKTAGWKSRDMGPIVHEPMQSQEAPNLSFLSYKMQTHLTMINSENANQSIFKPGSFRREQC